MEGGGGEEKRGEGVGEEGRRGEGGGEEGRRGEERSPFVSKRHATSISHIIWKEYL